MKTKLPPLSEHDIQNLIMSYLQTKGYYCMRLNSGAIITNIGKMVRLAEKGTPDIFFGLKSGKLTLLAFIEVKSEKGKLSFYQKHFKKECEERGILHIVARSIEDVEFGIKEYVKKLQNIMY